MLAQNNPEIWLEIKKKNAGEITMIWEDILKMKNKWGERLDSSDEKYLIKIIDKFMADTEDDFDLSIATAVAMQMHSFDKGSEGGTIKGIDRSS